jgi:PBSX family phage portal protein
MAEANTRRLFRRSKINQAVVRSTIFQIAAPDDSASRQIAYNDEFIGMAGAFGATILLPTPYQTARLFELIEQSNMLRQCIDAYVTNTVMTGWEVDALTRGRDVSEGEKHELQSFIDNANSEESLSTVMEGVIRDRESVGFGFLEIIRDALGDTSLFRRAPALWTRLCAKDPKDVLVEYEIARGRRVTSVKEWRRFRRYVQVVNGRQVWFREFGDPRKMDYTNGAFEGEDGYDARYQATELYHFKNPSNEAYGIPKWINQLPSIIGSREAEEVNMRYFQDNTVPPMLLLVGNGRLTQQSYKELTKNINQVGIGKERQNKIMLLEAVGEGDSMDGKGSAIELKVEKLTDARQSDGLFSQYDEANMAKVRSSFRLPPIVVGMSQDVNFATANVSAFIAESQVFGPERSRIDEILNKQIVNGKRGLNLRTCKLVSRTPAITSPDMTIKTLTALNVMGAITPRRAQQVANKMLQLEIEPYPIKGEDGYEEWMDKPIVFEAKKGTDPNGGTGTHAEANQKPDDLKDDEAEGNINPKRPKNGAQ